MTYQPQNINGQATKANSAPVVLASDQDALPLSTGAATSANQSTANTSLGTIDTNTAGIRTDLGADGGASPASGTGVRGWLRSIYDKLNGTLTVGLPTGAATSALQTTGNTSVGNIDTKTPALGQAVAGSSVPVVLPAAQVTTLTPPTTVTVNAGTNTSTAALADGTQQTQVVPGTATGYTSAIKISAATTNATSLKASAGTLGVVIAGSLRSTPAYLKLYNKASAPTVGTDTPIAVFLIPGSAASPTPGAGTNIPLPPQGLAFTTGIAYAITGGIANSDTTAVALNDVVLTLGYK